MSQKIRLSRPLPFRAIMILFGNLDTLLVVVAVAFVASSVSVCNGSYSPTQPQRARKYREISTNAINGKLPITSNDYEIKERVRRSAKWGKLNRDEHALRKFTTRIEDP